MAMLDLKEETQNAIARAQNVARRWRSWGTGDSDADAVVAAADRMAAAAEEIEQAMSDYLEMGVRDDG